MPGRPCRTASRTAATVPEWYTSAPRLPPALMPDSTQSTSPASPCRATRTQSAGVPVTAVQPGSRLSTCSGSSVVTRWLQPECASHGATTAGSPSSAAARCRAVNPGASMPSSLVRSSFILHSIAEPAAMGDTIIAVALFRSREPTHADLEDRRRSDGLPPRRQAAQPRHRSARTWNAAPPAGARLVVFPECVLTGYCFGRRRRPGRTPSRSPAPPRTPSPTTAGGSASGPSSGCWSRASGTVSSTPACWSGPTAWSPPTARSTCRSSASIASRRPATVPSRSTTSAACASA